MEDRISGYSQDEISEMKEFFKKNDITRFASLDKEYTLNGKKACIFAKAKKYLSDKWHSIVSSIMALLKVSSSMQRKQKLL